MLIMKNQEVDLLEHQTPKLKTKKAPKSGLENFTGLPT